MKKKLLVLLCAGMLAVGLTGCEGWNSKVSEMNGQITGNTYECQFYSNTGDKFMTLEGERIDMSPNIVREHTYSSDGGWGYTKTLSSVMTITIDGSQVESCGSTIIFQEQGLDPDVDFKQEEIANIQSQANGFGDYTMVANVVNEYRNWFGKPSVVVIQSQLGDPICAYSGDSVYWEVCEDLPKTTKLSIDGKLLYIHRGNFQIIDIDLLQ